MQLRLVHYEKAHLHYCPKTNLSLPVEQMHGKILQGRVENVFPSLRAFIHGQQLQKHPSLVS